MVLICVNVRNTNKIKMTEQNKSESLEDIIESDQAVEPDAKVAEKIGMLPDDISKQLDKQITRIERMNSALQSIQKQIKPLERKHPELIKHMQSQIKEIQKQTSLILKYVRKNKNDLIRNAMAVVVE